MEIAWKYLVVLFGQKIVHTKLFVALINKYIICF